MPTFNFTEKELDLLHDVLNMQLTIEEEHLENCTDSISRKITKQVIRGIKRLQKKTGVICDE